MIRLLLFPAPEDYQNHPVETALANATWTDRMLHLARKNDPRVFCASSSEVYGDPEVFLPQSPMRERSIL
jgi:nucleoside-diphosphate-sugar epimerase